MTVTLGDSRGTTTETSAPAGHGGVLLDHQVGTHAGLIVTGMRRWFAPFPTTSVVQRVTRLLGIDRQMTVLRDHVAAKGLGRSDIASALGVDRRTLSGYCTGEYRPSADRIERMRILAELVDAIDAAAPGRAREILRARRGGLSLLDRLRLERTSLFWTWHRYAEPEAEVGLEVSRQVEEPLWAAAARAFMEGRLAPPPRHPSVRPPAAFEMDLGEAEGFEEPSPRRGRESYR